MVKDIGILPLTLLDLISLVSPGRACPFRVPAVPAALSLHHWPRYLHPQTPHRHLFSGSLRPHLELRIKVRRERLAAVCTKCQSLSLFVQSVLIREVYNSTTKSIQLEKPFIKLVTCLPISDGWKITLWFSKCLL